MLGLKLNEQLSGGAGVVASTDGALMKLSAAAIWLDAKDIVTGSETSLPNRGTSPTSFDVIGPTLDTVEQEIVGDGSNDYVTLNYTPSYGLTENFTIIWVGRVRPEVGNWSRLVSFETAGSVGFYIAVNNLKRFVAAQSNQPDGSSITSTPSTVNDLVPRWMAATIRNGQLDISSSDNESGPTRTLSQDPSASYGSGRAFTVGHGVGNVAEVNTWAALVFEGPSAPDQDECAELGALLLSRNYS